MILRCKLFIGDLALEAVATSNSAHILPGVSGNHVAKIQRALNVLDKAKLIEDGIYGPATSAAVIGYKEKRGIINRSYQSQADNIVGVMTIRAIDEEMLTRLDPEVVIGTVVLSRAPARPFSSSFASTGGAVSPSSSSNTSLRSVVRGNPHTSTHASGTDGMPPSLPPRKTYSLLVTVDPPLTGTDDFIEIAVINGSAANGTATVTPARIQRSSNIVVTGMFQTKPGNAGRLQIQARLNGQEIKATSDGFSVCAHPINFTSKFHSDVNDGQVGMRVVESFQSDSGSFVDLDQVEVSEVVDLLRRSDPPFQTGSGRNKVSDYMPAIPPEGTILVDNHRQPRPTAGPAGMVDSIQLHIFRCLRCGAVDKPVPNSGYEIRDEVFQVGKEWKHRVTKQGQAVGISLPDNRGTVKTSAGKGKSRSPEHKLA
jgi:peptidoglycan hydrolase-like protein with peptidoglycan-binding domain